MFKITSRLICDRCNVAFGADQSHTERFDRKDLDRTRSAARHRGWSRFRPKSNLPMGDFCKECVERLNPAKATEPSRAQQS